AGLERRAGQAARFDIIAIESTPTLVLRAPPVVRTFALLQCCPARMCARAATLRSTGPLACGLKPVNHGRSSCVLMRVARLPIDSFESERNAENSALAACRECWAQVSTEAASCPHCDVPNPTQARTALLRHVAPPTESRRLRRCGRCSL